MAAPVVPPLLLLSVLLLAVSMLDAPSRVAALDNAAAPVPPLGWSTWNALRCKFDAEKLLRVADVMVSSGMVAAGYSRLHIDDCWMSMRRDAAGNIVPDPSKFPHGMGNFSAELATRGLGLGIYTAHGNKTCQHHPGSLGHEAQDAAAYALWNVSFVKNDWCWHGEPSAAAHLQAFNDMRDALNATGRRMVYSVHWNTGDTPGPGPSCGAGVVDCPLPATANMWRIGNDIKANWASVLRLIDTDQGHEAVVTDNPDSYNDADMLVVGDGMSTAQDQAHFTMWCILASPLVAGNDPTTMSADTARILTNAHAIAVNQDPMVRQATLIANGTGQVWARPLSQPHGSFAVALLNRGTTVINITADLTQLAPSVSATDTFDVLDLWRGAASIGVHAGSVSAVVDATAAVMYKLVPRG